MVARAVREALLAVRPSWRVEIIDFFEQFVGARFNRSVAGGYLASLQVAPFLYGLFYRAVGRIGESDRLQARLNAVGRKRLRAHLVGHPADLVATTYPTPAGVVSSLRLSGAVDTRLVTILTDYAVHSQWTHPGVDLYIVGNEGIREKLLRRGIPAAAVMTTGIPIRECFAGPRLARPGKGPLLVMVGALGRVRGTFRLCRALSGIADRTIVLCGHDDQLRRGLLGLDAASNGRLDVRGFVEEAGQLMAEARLLVTKPGGVTVSEALAMGLPMVAYGTIPGHERENEKLIVGAGAALGARSVAAVCDEVARLLGDDQTLSAMSERAAALGRPHAAWDAAAAIVSLLESHSAHH